MNPAFRKVLLTVILASGTLYSFLQWQQIIPHVDNVRQFLSAGGDLDRLRRLSGANRVGTEVRDVIPPGSVVWIVDEPGSPVFRAIAVRYALAPLTIGENWDYAVDLRKGSTGALEKGTRYRLKDDGVIWAKPGRAFLVPAASRLQGPSIAGDLCVFLLLSVFLTATGGLVLALLGFSYEVCDRWWFWTTGYLAGLLITSVVVWIYLMMGGRLVPQSIAMLWVGQILLLYGLKKFVFRIAPAIPVETQMHSFDRDGGGARRILPLLLAGLWIALFVLIIVSIPVSVSDEMEIWVYRAKIFFFEKALALPRDQPFYNYYPVLWPVNIAAQLTVLGVGSEAIAKWASAAALLAFLGQLRGAVLFLRIGATRVVLIVAAYLLVFFHWVLLTALPENLFLAVLTAAAAAAVFWLQYPSRGEFLRLALFFSAMLGGIKFEGAATAILLGICLLAAGRGLKLPAGAPPRLAGFFFFPLLLPALWFYWLLAHGYDISIFHLRQGFSAATFSAVLKVGREGLLQPASFFLAVAALGSLIAVRNPRPWNIAEKFLAWLSVALALFAFAAGLNWKAAQILNFYPEVLSRLLLRATPSLMVLWAARVFFKTDANSR